MKLSQYPSEGHGRSEMSCDGTSSAAPRVARAHAYVQLLASAIRSGKRTSFAIRGGCMWPTIRAGDRVRVGPLQRAPRIGDVLICYRGTHMVAHRVVQHYRDARGESWIRCRGDAALAFDAPVRPAEVLGVVDAIERAGRTLAPRAAAAWSSRVAAPLRAAWAWLSTRSRWPMRRPRLASST